MPQSLTTFLVHLIFSTKDREPFIDPEIKDRLFSYVGAVWNKTGGKPILINGPADHVHVLASLSSTCTIADAVRILKSNTSKWVHDTFPTRAGFGWQSGYAAFSVSRRGRACVR
jgi:putative transposase